MYHEITGSLENVFRSFDTRFRYLKAGFSCVDNGFLRGRDNASSCSMIPLSFEVCDSDPPTTLEGFIKKMALDSFEPGRKPSTALPAAGSCRLVLPQREARHDRRASLLGRGQLLDYSGLLDPGFGGVEVDCAAPVDLSALPEGGMVAALDAGSELSCC
jgi:hypothetical protein